MSIAYLGPRIAPTRSRGLLKTAQKGARCFQTATGGGLAWTYLCVLVVLVCASSVFPNEVLLCVALRKPIAVDRAQELDRIALMMQQDYVPRSRKTTASPLSRARSPLPSRHGRRYPPTLCWEFNWAFTLVTTFPLSAHSISNV